MRIVDAMNGTNYADEYQRSIDSFHFPKFGFRNSAQEGGAFAFDVVSLAAGGAGLVKGGIVRAGAAMEAGTAVKELSVAERAASVAARGATQQTARVGELIPTHGKTMSNRQLDKLTKNVRAEGIKEPLTVTEHNGKLYILDGHHRALAAPRAGIAEVPINKVELPFGAYRTPADLVFTPGGY